MKMKNPLLGDPGDPDDKDIEHLANTLMTQQAIIKYAMEMAVVLAEAGRASHKATGDAPERAIRRWADVIVQEAMRLVKEPVKTIEQGVTIDADAGSVGEKGTGRLLEDTRRLQRKAD